jgi:hypothetical protein
MREKKKICYKKTPSFEEGLATTTTSYNCCSSVLLLCFFVCNFFKKKKNKETSSKLLGTPPNQHHWTDVGSLRTCPEILRNGFPDPEATDSASIGVMMSDAREKLHFQNHCGRCPS